MPPNRRKKILPLLFLLIFLVLAAGYIFRYPLLLRFQYSRLQSLHCPSGQARPEGSCLDRLWVHRVNSRERYELLKDKFNGFEIDIVYNSSSRSFSVYHPRLAAGERDRLSLQEFFKDIDLTQKKFWLDTRFVGESNMKEALQALSAIHAPGAIQQTCILELYDLPAAVFFAENGYTVSFNVSPTLQQQMQKDGLLKDSIVKRLLPVRYVSQESQYLPAVKNLFPAKQVLTWDPRFSNFFNTDKLQQLLDDTSIAVILVNIKSRFYR